MQRIRRTSHSLSVPIIAVLVVLAFMLNGWKSPTAYADSSEQYSSVLSDLQKDDSFNADDYPALLKDYSVSVIQLAESTDRELLVYTYTPKNGSLGEKLVASEIRFATSIGDDFSPHDYKLKLVDSSGTLSKYIVEDFTVLSDKIRYYNVICVFRPFDANLDEEPADDNTISAVSYEVGQLWTATTTSDGVKYTKTESQTITITNKHCGFIRYYDGSKITWTDTHFSKYTDAHYVAFDTSFPIDTLYEADLSFNSVYYFYVNPGVTTFHELTLTSKQAASNISTGMFADKHEWKRIESIDEFMSNESLTSDTITALSGDKWVLRFYETEYNAGDAFNKGSYRTDVEDVSILRLKFKTNGKTYNLGVVDNKQSGDSSPDGYGSAGKISFSGWNAFWGSIRSAVTSDPNWWKKLLVIVAAVIVLVIVVVLIATFGLPAFFKGLWWLIFAPFKGIAKLVEKIKEKRQ